MDKIMLDTCVWYDFALIEIFEGKNKKRKQKTEIPERLKKCKELWDRLQTMALKNEIEILTANWGILELRDQITRLVWDRKLIDNGYSQPEFREARRDNPLDEKDFETIDRLCFVIPKLCGEKISDISINFPFVLRFCKSGTSAFDAIHIQQANDNECDYFVTKDGDLIEQCKKDKLKVNVIHVKEFLPIIRKK